MQGSLILPSLPQISVTVTVETTRITQENNEEMHIFKTFTEFGVYSVYNYWLAI